MTACPRCHLEFRSVIYRKVEKAGFQPDHVWRERLECGHIWEREVSSWGVGPILAERRACRECLAAHHKEIGVV